MAKTRGEKEEELVINYEPREWANEFMHSNSMRWMVFVIHRRAGKTTAALNQLLRDACENDNARYAYIAPTYKQAKNVAWDILKLYANDVKAADFNESELSVRFAHNGSKITLYGSDNPDSLRGIGLWGVVFDEYSQQPSNIFTEIIRPALADHNGYAIWIGTPKGKNEFYRLYQKGKERDSDFFSILLDVDKTQLIPKSELESSRQTMSADEFNQEWYCSFEAAIKGAIYGSEIADARKARRITSVPYDKEALVHTFWDLGVGASLAVGFYQRVGTEIHKIDYWEGTEKEGIVDAIAVIRNKRYVYGKHYAPHDIRATELSTGKTRLQMAQKLGFDFEVVPDIGVQEGIDAAKRIWSHMWIDETTCQVWIDYISQYQRVWDDRKGMFLDTPRHDFTSHAADEFRYMSVMEKEITNQKTKVKWKQPAYEPISPNEYVAPRVQGNGFGEFGEDTESGRIM